MNTNKNVYYNKVNIKNGHPLLFHILLPPLITKTNWYYKHMTRQFYRSSGHSITQLIVWLAPRAGKMNQIARCDWLPERTRRGHLARSGLPAVSRKKNFHESHIINPLLAKFVRSRWLDIGQVLFCEFKDRDEVEVHKYAKKNSANLQPSWPHTWWKPVYITNHGERLRITTESRASGFATDLPACLVVLQKWVMYLISQDLIKTQYTHWELFNSTICKSYFI